jgi:hypothetical protein
MRVKLIIFLAAFSLFSFSAQHPVWDVGYIYFDESDPETYLRRIYGFMPIPNRIEINGSYYLESKKYRKTMGKDRAIFYICDEEFEFDKKKKHTIDTLSVSLLDDIPFLSDESIQELLRWGLGKSNLFRKLYIIEKHNTDKIIRTQVYWEYFEN